ncbi:MAG: T9SS type A sorting domain-containing protein [Bacteroidetes bacterium]|nr:T9SS type A sorting domain-containing protein [Bacteroidota bacterium]
MKKAILFFVFVFSILSLTQAQTILFQNPSFEGTPTPHITPPYWNICMPGTTPDTQPGSWGITLPASNDSTYIGLVEDDSIVWVEGATQQLLTPILQGHSYFFTLDLATTTVVGSGIDPGDVELQLYGGNGGNSGCDCTELLWSSGNVTNLTWQTHIATFVPTNTYSQMLFLIHSLDSTKKPYIMVDNLSGIFENINPGVYLTPTPLSCINSCDGSISSIMIGGTPPFHYLWSPTGDTTSSISNLCSGTNILNVIDSNNIVYSDTVTISPGYIGTSPLFTPSICVVSVDTSINKNVIIWEKPLNSQIDSFLVFKETSVAGNYVQIGSNAYSNYSTFIDYASIPAQQANRYKLGIKDSCGRITILSDPHKTIHLTVSTGIGGTWNLNWDNYEGFLYSSVNIYRGTTSSNLSLLTSLSSTLFSYTDLTPPPGVIYYLIEAINPVLCNPSYKTGNDIASTLSNIVTNAITNIETQNENTLFSAFPNPASDGINIQLNQLVGNNYSLQLVNFLGEIVYSKNKLSQQTQYIETNNLSDGLYFIQLKTDKSISSKKIIIKKNKN